MYKICGRYDVYFPINVDCLIIYIMGKRRFVHTRVHNNKAIVVLGLVVITIPLASLYLGYMIGNIFTPSKNMMPDVGVLQADPGKLNISVYNTKHLAVSFSGGLGSQMFQYASLYGIAKANGLKPLITSDTSNCQLTEIFPYLNAETSKFPRPGTKFPKFREHKTNAFDQRSFQLNYMHDIELEGEYKSWRYFDHVRREIQAQFMFSNKAVSIIQEFLHKAKTKLSSLANLEEFTETQYVGMHIRRGDVTSKENSDLGYVPVDKNYLAAAMQYFKHKIKHVIFVVTSDDLDWCRENIDTNKHLVVFSTYQHPGLDMCLLSQCNHTIVSVGSFGWWGAWLAGGDTLYYRDSPRVGSHLADQYRRTDYFPTNWIAV